MEFEGLEIQLLMVNELFAIGELWHEDGRIYQINSYIIDMEVEEDFIDMMCKRDLYSEGCDCGCNGKK